MAYNNKCIPTYIAMDIYMEEVVEPRRIADEMELCYFQRDSEVAERIALETHRSWEEYDELMLRQEMDEAEELFWELRFWDEILEAEPWNIFSEEDYELWLLELQTQVKAKNTRAQRRKQKVRHKRKLCNEATQAMLNFGKRFSHDMRNMSFCKTRSGEHICMPKYRSNQALALWSMAQKLHLVEGAYPT